MPVAETTGPPSPGAVTRGAIRMRKLRQARAAGILRVVLELRPEAIEDLCLLGWLDSEQRRDHRAVAAAFAEMAGEALAQRVARPQPGDAAEAAAQ